jgi:type IV pilus assembly protein PilC
MRYSLASGLMLRDVMELLAVKGTPVVRPVAASIATELKAGWGLQDALDKHENAFPPLFRSLAAVGEESGSLPEVLHELERYYLLQQKLRRDFISQITWPVLQLFAAILVIAGLILILGLLPTENTSGQKVDALGLGLIGSDGAVQFLGIVAAIIIGGWALFVGLKYLLRRRAIVERVLLRTPLIGKCLMAIVLTRFCIAMRLMLDTTVSITKTLRLCFLATDNAAFVAALPQVMTVLKQGNSITTSLQAGNIFPEKFLGTLAVAEESGKMTEVLRHQAEEYDEEAKRRMGTINQVLGYLVWLTVAALIILAIYRLFTALYLGRINQYLGS